MKPAVLKKIDDTSKLNAIRAREIIIIVRNKFPNSVYIRVDIYNVRTILCRCNFEGYILIGALIKLFDDNDIEYIKKMDLEDPERLLGIVFTFPDCMEMAKKFLEVSLLPLYTV